MFGWGKELSYVMPVERLTPASNADTAKIWISKRSISAVAERNYSGGHPKCSERADRAESMLRSEDAVEAVDDGLV